VLRSRFVVLIRSAFGSRIAFDAGMVARRFEDLEAYQLADKLKREVYALLATGSASKDFRFCNQLRESAASSPRNIAEGFGRFRPAPFAHFMEFAIASTMETQVSLQDGVDRGYFTADSIATALSLSERSIKVSTKLLTYLKHCNP
jgi:four helix bundle protein